MSLGIAEIVSSSISSVTSTINTLSNNKSDEQKAVSAAKSAGKKAQRNAEDLYPNWDLKGTKELAEKEGITSRAEWKRARNSAGQQAYDEAYKGVMQLYQAVVAAKCNGTYKEGDVLVDGYNSSNDSKFGSSGVGCLGASLALVISGSGLVYLLFNLIKVL